MSSICQVSSFLFELTSMKWCERELQIAEHTAVDWNLYMRSACVEVFGTQRQEENWWRETHCIN